MPYISICILFDFVRQHQYHLFVCQLTIITMQKKFWRSFDIENDKLDLGIDSFRRLYGILFGLISKNFSNNRFSCFKVHRLLHRVQYFVYGNQYKYRRPSQFADFLFVILPIHGLVICTKIQDSRSFLACLR